MKRTRKKTLWFLSGGMLAVLLFAGLILLYTGESDDLPVFVELSEPTIMLAVGTNKVPVVHHVPFAEFPRSTPVSYQITTVSNPPDSLLQVALISTDDSQCYDWMISVDGERFDVEDWQYNGEQEKLVARGNNWVVKIARYQRRP